LKNACALNLLLGKIIFFTCPPLKKLLVLPKEMVVLLERCMCSLKDACALMCSYPKSFSSSKRYIYSLGEMLMFPREMLVLPREMFVYPKVFPREMFVF
jgi:hypothetical protein